MAFEDLQVDLTLTVISAFGRSMPLIRLQGIAMSAKEYHKIVRYRILSMEDNHHSLREDISSINQIRGLQFSANEVTISRIFSTRR